MSMIEVEGRAGPAKRDSSRLVRSPNRKPARGTRAKHLSAAGALWVRKKDCSPSTWGWNRNSASAWPQAKDLKMVVAAAAGTAHLGRFFMAAAEALWSFVLRLMATGEALRLFSAPERMEAAGAVVPGYGIAVALIGAFGEGARGVGLRRAIRLIRVGIAVVGTRGVSLPEMSFAYPFPVSVRFE